MKLTISEQFQQFLSSIGVDIEEIFQYAGVPNKLWQEELTLSVQEYYRVLRELDRLVTDEVIIEMSKIQNMHLFIPSFFAALSAKNGYDAIYRFARFKKLVGPINVHVVETDDFLEVILAYSENEMTLPRFSILNEQLIMINLLRTGSSMRINPVLVQSPYPYSDAIVNVLGINPTTSEGNKITFRKRDLIQPFVTKNNAMWKFLEPELNRQLIYGEDNSFSNYVHKEIIEEIPSGKVSVSDISEKLGISSRTMQRKLQEEKTSYKEQLQLAQKEMTMIYLQMNLSTSEISELVGYTEVSSFLRAFKQWTGKNFQDFKQTSHR